MQAHARAWAVRADSCRCRTLVDSPIFKAVLKPLIGELPVYTMIGLMMPYLFQVSASVPARTRQLQPASTVGRTVRGVRPTDRIASRMRTNV